MIAPPHIVSKSRWWHGLWWSLRGVRTSEDYMRRCARCRQRGLVHFGWAGCIRFKRS